MGVRPYSEHKNWRERNPERWAAITRRNSLMRRYGISPEQYEVLHEAQDGVCAICKEPETARYQGTLRRLSVDHCHESGKVRGLLCGRCNQSIGRMRDSPALLEEAARYLRNPDLEV